MIIAYVADNYFIFLCVTMVYHAFNAYSIEFLSHYLGEINYYLSMHTWFTKT